MIFFINYCVFDSMYGSKASAKNGLRSIYNFEKKHVTIIPNKLPWLLRAQVMHIYNSRQCSAKSLYTIYPILLQLSTTGTRDENW